MPSFIHHPHDKLFRLSMSNMGLAKNFLQTHLPVELLKQIDLATLKQEDHTFIDAAYKANAADLVYSVQIKQNLAYIYVLCEQQTEVDMNMAFRLLVYTIRLMESHLRRYPNTPLPLVYPLVVYSGSKPWNAGLDIFALFGEQEAFAREWFLKPYQLVDIQRMHDETLKQHAWCGLVEFALKYREVRDFKALLEVLLPWVRQIEIENKQAGVFLGKVVLQYLIDGIQTEDTKLFTEKVNLYLKGELKGEAMTLAQAFEKQGLERGLQQGMQQGMKQGVQQGVQQGEATLLTRLIERRFGRVPRMYLARITEADAQTLLLWGEKVLDAMTLEEIFI